MADHLIVVHEQHALISEQEITVVYIVKQNLPDRNPP